MKHKHGITVMRLQPFHYGHIDVILKMIKDCDFVTVVIGSIQEAGTDKNPFSYFTRLKMLKNIFLSSVNCVGVMDINQSKAWTKYVFGSVVSEYKRLPLPDVYYCGEEDSNFIKEFEKLGLDAVSIPRNGISGTKIRESIISGTDDWKLMVPKINHQEIQIHYGKS